jgi:two-component system, cell cycle sensor histidine kinase and response regulator CckA
MFSEPGAYALADSLPLLIWIDGPDKVTTFFNKAWIEFTGRTLTEELGGGWAALLHPDDVERIYEVYDRAHAARAPFEVEYRLRRHDGVYRWLLDRGTPRYAPGGVFLGYVGGCIDITERVEVQEALHQNAARYRALLKAIPDNMAHMDRAGTYLAAHLAGDPPFPYGADDLVGRNLFDIMPSETAEQVRAAQERAIDTGQVQTLEYKRTINGVEYVLESRIAKTGEDEVVALVRNITERKQTEELLLRAQRHESISTLASGIAHDFNNLLTGVLGQVTLALKKLPAKHSARSNLEKAVDSTQRVANLTRQLLAYSGQGAFQVEMINLNELIMDNFGLFETVLPKGAGLQLELEADLPAVEMDRGQAQQVIMNLVFNAADAIAAGSGAILIRTGALDLSQGQESDNLTPGPLPAGRYVGLTVADTGIGMSRATLTRIFDPYFTTKMDGTGLGLSAMLGIVRQAGGAIRVHSEPGRGTEMSVFLPAFAEPVPEPAVETRTVTDVRGAVLVVDDEPFVREVVSDILTQQGMRVLVAGDGYEGLEQFKTHRAEIDLILLDMKMPGMNGEQVYHAVRAIDDNCRVILSSGYLDTDSTTQLSQRPFTSFLPKPYDLETLVNSVKEMLA